MIVAISEMISDLPDENLNPTISTRASKKGTAASNAYNMIFSVSAALPGSILFIYHIMIIQHMGYYGPFFPGTQLPV